MARQPLLLGHRGCRVPLAVFRRILSLHSILPLRMAAQALSLTFA